MAYRRRGNSWIVDVTVGEVRRYRTVKTEEAAKLTELQLELEMRGEAPASPVSTPSTVLPQSSWTLQEALTKALEVHWKGTKSHDWYQRMGGYLVAYFGAEKPLASITTTVVDKYREKMEKDGLGRATINHRLVTLAGIFKVAIKRTEESGVVGKPSFGVRKVNRGRIRWLSDEEERLSLTLLTQWGKQDFKDWFEVATDTGMRPIEALKLGVTEVDFRTGLITIWETKTEAGTRSIPMTARVRAILDRRCVDLKQGRVFPFTHEWVANGWSELRKALRLSADPDFVPYVLRHTFATRLVQRGVRIEVIQKLLGHKSITQTMIYAHLGAHQFVDAIKALEGSPQ